jgi:hypothetical protein
MPIARWPSSYRLIARKTNARVRLNQFGVNWRPISDSPRRCGTRAGAVGGGSAMGARREMTDIRGSIFGPLDMTFTWSLPIHPSNRCFVSI